MKWSIKTIKIDDVYMTFNEYWDDPDIEQAGYTFPNHRVGKGTSKEQSVKAFEKYIEESYKPLLASVKENVRLACEVRK